MVPMAATVRLRAGLAAPIPYDLITDRRSIFMHRGVGNDMGDLGEGVAVRPSPYPTADQVGDTSAFPHGLAKLV